jgi:hypothetical protein
MRNGSGSDEHRLLPRLRAHQDSGLSSKVKRIVSEAELNVVGVATAGGDPAALRGLPVVGVRGGFGSVMRGTKPGSKL